MNALSTGLRWGCSSDGPDRLPVPARPRPSAFLTDRAGMAGREGDSLRSHGRIDQPREATTSVQRTDGRGDPLRSVARGLRELRLQLGAGQRPTGAAAIRHDPFLDDTPILERDVDDRGKLLGEHRVT